MTKRAEDADLLRRIRAIEPKGEIAVDAGAVASVVEAVVASLSGDMSVADLKLYQELEHLAHYIQSAKREIAALRPHDITERIPAATDELDAVVDHTAEATGTILDAAERLEKLAPSLPAETRDVVGTAVTSIYEACNFQDITGQRITKVVKTLKFIEQKIDALLGAFGDGVAVPPPEPEPEPLDENARLMHGPQLPREANKQDEIDAILAEFDRQ
ncbi:MAG TPA: protein phosphatase CheZ [Stellaceae bacterium]|nr:protein phosphatase CheZ [Stellaceae bacterium]